MQLLVKVLKGWSYAICSKALFRYQFSLVFRYCFRYNKALLVCTAVVSPYYKDFRYQFNLTA